MSDEDARHAARRAFGGVLKTRQLYREQHGWGWLDHLVQDARFALRTLVRDRGFALTAMLVLGLGVGINNMQFTIIYTHTLRALPIADADRVLMGSLVDERGSDRTLSYAEYQALLKDAHLFEGLGAFGGSASVSLDEPGHAPDRHPGVYTTATAFELLRIRPLAGRTFSAVEQAPGATRVALLGEGAWRARYLADPALVGREVLIDGKPTVVIGIIRAESRFPSTAEVFLPIVQAPQHSEERRMLRAVGRGMGGSSVDAAQAQLTTMLANVGVADAGCVLCGWFPHRRGRVRQRGEPHACPRRTSWPRNRHSKLARRQSASHRVQLLAESVALALAGAVVGGAVSMAGVRIFRLGVPQEAMPYWFQYSMDLTIFAALVAISLGTVMIFGLVPAGQASRTDASRVRPGWAGGRSRSDRESWRRLSRSSSAACATSARRRRRSGECFRLLSPASCEVSGI